MERVDPTTPRWIWPEPVSEGDIASLEHALRLRRPVCEILVRRGYGDPDLARRFLRPTYSDLHDPNQLPDLAAGVERIERAIDRDERILVHGDYDVDGMSAAALLVRALETLGARTDVFIPDRIRDGYDLGEAGVTRAVERGATLIVTADCGTTAVQAVEQAAGQGIDVVVTDHHRPGPHLPDAVAVINPSRSDSEYPFSGLAGVGVAFKLVSQLYIQARVDEEHLNQHLDLVALGTVADMAPLTDENRLLVRLGLRALERTRKTGLQALLWGADLGRRERLEASDIGFRLGPRLNSTGRIGSADAGLRLLLAEDRDEAIDLARHVESENVRRRAVDRRVLEEARSELDRRHPDGPGAGVVLWSDSWHPGVLGIAASRLAETVRRPTVLIHLEGDVGRGSARSIGGVDLYRALEGCADLLERFGGHTMAAGLQVRRDRIEAFATAFDSAVAEQLDPDEARPRVVIDAVLSAADATVELMRELEHLGPHGPGNPRPIVVLPGVELTEIRTVGADQNHLQARVRDADGTGEPLDLIGFGFGERAEELSGGGRWNVAVELVLEEWRGARRPKARLVGLTPPDDATVAGVAAAAATEGSVP